MAVTNYGKWLQTHTLAGNKWKAAPVQANAGKPIVDSNQPAAPGYGSGSYGASTKPNAGAPIADSTQMAAPLAHDSIYNAAADNAQRAKGYAEADFQYGLTNAPKAYGLRATVNPDNTFSISEVDPSSPDYNPFNQMAMLRKHFEQQQTGNTNSYAARGQLYAGSLQNAQNTAQEGYNQDHSSLEGSFGDYIRGLITQRRGAYGAADDALSTAGGDEAQRRIDNAAPIVPAAHSAGGGDVNSTVAPFVNSGTGKDVPLTPLQQAAAFATGGVAGSQQMVSLWQRALNDPGLAAKLLDAWKNKQKGAAKVTTGKPKASAKKPSEFFADPSMIGFH